MTPPRGRPKRNIPNAASETGAVFRLGRPPPRHTAGRPARTARHHISNEAAPQTDVSASDSPMLLLVGLRRSFVRTSVGFARPPPPHHAQNAWRGPRPAGLSTGDGMVSSTRN